MKRRRRWLWIALTFVLLAAFGVWLEPTRVVWGWLAGEPFYGGRPVSFWRHELLRWDLVYLKNLPGGQTVVQFTAPDIDQAGLKQAGFVARFIRRPDWAERAWKTVRGQRMTVDTDAPPILAGDPAAGPVLQALAAENVPVNVQLLLAYGRAAIAARAAAP